MNSGLTEIPRFWSQVDQSGGPLTCWPWMRSTSTTGYSRFGVKRHGEWKRVQGHRYSYELVVGPIPDGLFLDHLCRNRLCVNPAHLEPVTNGENVRRGTELRGCLKRGHPWTVENSGVRKVGRRCRACHREEARESRARRGIVLRPERWKPDPERRLPAKVAA